jgi:hypothetical protein
MEQNLLPVVIWSEMLQATYQEPMLYDTNMATFTKWYATVKTDVIMYIHQRNIHHSLILWPTYVPNKFNIYKKGINKKLHSH